MYVLVCGAGIAGLTLSLGLLRDGHDLLVVEKSPSLRDEGYMMDFFGPGYDASEKMGLLPDLEKIHYPIGRLAFIDPKGRETFAITYTAYRRLFDGRHFYIMRGDLERLLHRKSEGRVRIRFGTTVDALKEDGKRMRVVFSDGTTGSFDLVVGADGAHSRIRRLVFGEEGLFRRFLGYVTAAFLVQNPPESFTAEDAFRFLTGPGRQVAVYPIRGGRLAAFLLHRAGGPLGHIRADEVARDLCSIYGELGWIVPELLGRREPSALFIDDVSQIAMRSWSLGRVVLVGDACQSLSPLTAQGASMAMAGAYVLAGELGRSQKDTSTALVRYEKRVKPAASRVQAAGRRLAPWFVPESRSRLAIRDIALRAAEWPVAPRVFRRVFAVENIIGA